MKAWLLYLLIIFIVIPGSVYGQSSPASGLSNNLNIDIKVTTGSVLPAMAKVEVYRGSALFEERTIGGIGRYAFVGLRDGEYTVNVTVPGFMPESRTAFLRNGMQTQMSFMLRPLETPATTIPGDPIVDQRWERTAAKAREGITNSREARRNKNFKAAIDHANAAVAADSKSVLAVHELALAYWKSGDEQKARKSFNAAMQTDPTFLNSYLALAEMLVEGKQYQEAGSVLMQAAKAQPDRAEPFKAMAQIQLETGHPDKAEQACRLGLALDHSRIPDIYVILANIQLRKGEKVKAADSLQMYLTKAPNGELADQVRKTLGKIKD